MATFKLHKTAAFLLISQEKSLISCDAEMADFFFLQSKTRHSVSIKISMIKKTK